MKPDFEEITREGERWEAEHLDPEDLQKVMTDSGLPVDVIYTPADIQEMSYLKELGFPGEYPFTRGVYPSMYRGRLWTMRQYAGFGTAEESNARYKFLLDQGQTGLSVAFDLPTQMGYDSDNLFVEEEVGCVGVAVDTLRDMEILFDGIPLDKISMNLTINAPAAVILAMYIAVGEVQGVKVESLGGTVQNDILKEYLARKTYVFPPQPSLRLTADIIEFCHARMPHFNPISITGYHVREAGASAVQEVAYTLSTAITYVEEVLARGIDIDDFAPRLSFHFSMSSDFLEEIAKIRACRRLWARIMRERFGAKDPRSQKMRFFNGGSGTWLTAEEPLNNIVRGTLQCLAGVLAGAQACHVPAYDEAYAIPSEASALLALRTQQIIAYETGMARTVDPLGGSYYLESLTNLLEDKVEELIIDIENRGGFVVYLERGEPQKAILDRAYEIERKIASGERVVVGVNAFRAERGAGQMELEERDPLVVSRQIARLKQVKAQRDEASVQRALEELRSAAESHENIMPPVLAAVKTYATVGEVMDVLREVFGGYKEPVII